MLCVLFTNNRYRYYLTIIPPKTVVCPADWLPHTVMVCSR